MGKILGVFCLTGLRFFLGVFFLGEEQLYILLCVFFNSYISSRALRYFG